MKKLFFLITIFLTINIAKAELPNIVALVNDNPITLNEFRARKQMIIALNNISNLNSIQNKQLDKTTIESLINDHLLFQHGKDKQISEQDIDNAITDIEKRNQMQKGHLIEFLKSKSVDINSFRSQIKAELIKMSIVSHLSRSVSVSPKEIDTIILDTNSKDVELLARIFTTKNNDKDSLNKIYNLQKHLKNCDNIKNSLYDSFATMEIIDNTLSNLNPILQTIIKDLNINQTSSVFKMKDKFKLVLVCNKKVINLSPDESNYVVHLLTDKKISKEMQKVLNSMHKKSYIRIMLPM